MKVLIIFIAALVAVNAVLEENKILIEEINTIERASSACKEKSEDERKCDYKCALEKLNYDQTAVPETASYRKLCKQNTTAIENECKRAEEFVYCLHREVQNEVNQIRDECVVKYGADMQAYRSETLENLIRKQSYACFMFCFQKNTGVMNDDMSFNFGEKRSKNATLFAMIEECAKESAAEETKCSKAASRYYCLEHKITGH